MQSSVAPGESFVHPALGPLEWDSMLNWWKGSISTRTLQNTRICIGIDPDPEGNIRNAVAFLQWVDANLEAFLHKAADEAFERDVVWDYKLGKQRLASMLSIKSVVVDSGVRVTFDTCGATTDHGIQAALDDRHEITDMLLC